MTPSEKEKLKKYAPFLILLMLGGGAYLYYEYFMNAAPAAKAFAPQVQLPKTQPAGTPPTLTNLQAAAFASPSPSPSPSPSGQNAAVPPAPFDPYEGIAPAKVFADIQTSKGLIVIELHQADAPITVKNFIDLAEGKVDTLDSATNQMVRKPFYNGLTFHRVVRNKFIQTGCPLGTGFGDPGFRIPAEFNAGPDRVKRGDVLMAYRKDQTAGSQFFIALGKMDDWLDYFNTVFGHVVQGDKILDKIGTVAVDKGHKPVEPVLVTEVKIRRFYDQPPKIQEVKAAEIRQPASTPATPVHINLTPTLAPSPAPAPESSPQ